tara:strand:- start:287 stop:526 length:240 start_codon:yes stop_codon:yes gene_type:complete
VHERLEAVEKTTSGRLREGVAGYVDALAAAAPRFAAPKKPRPKLFFGADFTSRFKRGRGASRFTNPLVGFARPRKPKVN